MSSNEIFYQEQNNEVSLFNYAFEHQLPVLIKGPTGCGKTRFITHMAQKLNKPLYTVACHDDLTAAEKESITKVLENNRKAKKAYDSQHKELEAAIEKQEDIQSKSEKKQKELEC